jgi:serine protease Do
MRRILMPLFLGCCSFLGGLTAMYVSTNGLPFARADSAGSSDLGRLSDRFENVARKVAPTVVAVESSRVANKGGKSKTVEESGSGVLVRLPNQKGVFVFTNNHVIQQAAADQITISLADNRILKPAQVWTDPESDVAVLRVESPDVIPTANLGDSEQTRVGQWVLAFGSPFGLNQTVTHGIISARERGQISLGATIRIKEFLQTDAAINPGSSGGPLVNLDGDVIGINTAIASNSGSNSGVSFSIPINMVTRIAKQLLEKGVVARGYLGVQMAPSFEAADAIKLGMERAQGALVETVYADTPAAAAGFRTNDVVLEVNGTTIRNENHFINLISSLPVGQRIKVTVWRERKTIALDAEVGDWSKGQSRLLQK